MKKWLFGVLCLALTNTAWAQSPVAIPTAQLAGSGPILVPAMPMAASQVQQTNHGCAAPCATAPCCTPMKTICVPEPATKIKVSVQYCSICEKICYPKCSLFGAKCGCDSGCGQPGHDCGHPYTKRVLVKKFVEEELPRNKCVAVTVPACEANHCAQPCMQAVVAPAAPMPKK
jgi:hypothetical protein